MTKKRILAAVLAVACACACLLALCSCGSSANKDFIGEWKIKNTQVTVVFSDTEFKLVGNTFEYSVDSGKKVITYKPGGAEGSAKYSFTDNGKTLTLEEDNGGTTKTTVFEKVSNNGNAEPSAGVPSEGM